MTQEIRIFEGQLYGIEHDWGIQYFFIGEENLSEYLNQFLPDTFSQHRKGPQVRITVEVLGKESSDDSRRTGKN